jgi:type II secretory pathway pseudopilin PulG
MTMIELLVSMGILTLIVLAFGTILSQTRQVADKSSAFMQANASATVIAQALRDDLARLAPQGFLAVYTDSVLEPNRNQRLVFTAVRPFTSQVNAGIATNAARIAYGLDANSRLWRKAVLLSNTTTTTDVENAWLGQYDPNCHPTTPIDLNANLPTYCADPIIPLNITLTNMVSFWPLLAGSCSRFQVSWWNTGTSKWVSDANTWDANDFAERSSTAHPPPPAIKVNFRLKTGTDPNEDYMDYEVICPIRR